ncbi:thioredoxin family protein [Sporosarcina obsidiansis]|uniref:thioredoxin family protein n=1 Tax=Sporosarcina obsidiansis TaxID=2660748 RepID=UPI00129A754B|nr:thioredoxin family protein [Sporosarcina obsidiansis]
MNSIQSKEQYLELIANKKATVLFFSADWCPDCKFIDGFFDEIMEKNKDDFDFYKVNPDSQQEVCEAANVMGIPSFVTYQNGSVIAEMVGNDSRTKEEVENYLARSKAAK